MRVGVSGSSVQTGTGGWFPDADDGERFDVWGSHWCSLEISEEDCPCVFEQGRKPSLVISTLEVLEVLVSLKVFHGDDPDDDTTRVFSSCKYG